jgi:hypothetical protein
MGFRDTAFQIVNSHVYEETAAADCRRLEMPQAGRR